MITPKTRAIVLNTPNNPTGRVFDRDELQAVVDVCIEHDIIAITDEIYEHIYYEGEHIPLATFDGMRDRTVLIGQRTVEDVQRDRLAHRYDHRAAGPHARDP